MIAEMTVNLMVDEQTIARIVYAPKDETYHLIIRLSDGVLTFSLSKGEWERRWPQIASVLLALIKAQTVDRDKAVIALDDYAVEMVRLRHGRLAPSLNGASAIQDYLEGRRPPDSLPSTWLIFRD